MENIFYKTEISEIGRSKEEVLDDFYKKIGAIKFSEESFILNDEKWFLDFHPFSHSDDIIIKENIAKKYDNFLLVKSGGEKVRIAGWCSKEKLMALDPKDIYRNGTNCYVVMDTNLNDLTNFKIEDPDYVLQDEFIINQQEAENLGHTEMISGILAGIHKYCKDAEIRFEDINQQDEFIIGDKTAKIYTRDYLSDEDMLVSEKYYQKNKNRVDIYILCKIKGGNYNYLGYVEKEIVEGTRVVQMIGADATSSASDDKRRIFAEQYLNLNDLIKIYKKIDKEELVIEKQNYVPLHVHSEWSVGDGYGSVSYLAETLKKKGFSACALTDHGTLAGVWEFQKACLVNGIKPILGSEFYVSTAEDPKKKYHLTVLVKNRTGWLNILRLQDCATRYGFYYKPTLKFEDLFKYHEGLVVMSGCSSGIFTKLIRENSPDLEKWFDKFKDTFKEDFYAEIQPQNYMDNQEIMQKLFLLAKEKGVKSVFTNDSHYPLKEDKYMHDAVKAINFKKKYGEAGFSDDCFYIMQEKDIQERLKTKSPWMLPVINEMLETTNEISEKCNYEIKPGNEQDTLPKIDMEAVKTEKPDLYKEFENWKKEGNLPLSNYHEVENE